MGKKFLKTTLYIFALAPLFACASNDIGSLNISIDGRPSMVITDPDGNRTGSQGLETWQESPDVRFESGFDYQNIQYTSLLEGDYTVSFRGQHDEQFTVTIATFVNNKYREINFERWVNKLEPASMTFNISKNDDGTLSLSSPQFNRPNGRGTKNDNGNTVISWDAVSDADSYSVFYKYFDYPYYAHLVDTTSTSTQTDVPWATDSGDPLRPDGVYYFVIQAHYSDGTRSVLSQIISNDDQDNDRFNDWREIDQGTDPNNSDSDGDGLNDFEEMNRYYTDPNNIDSDDDGHADGVEVEAGTLPNQSVSYPGRESECDAPESGDWNVSSDCTVVRDQDVPGDIIVHPNVLMRIANNITLWFDYINHKILILFGGGIKLDNGASIQQK